MSRIAISDANIFFDRFLDAVLFDKYAARNLLTDLIQFNPWLPKEDCIKKLKRWQ